jgi:Fur family ferric uptake transcriptional regulator
VPAEKRIARRRTSQRAAIAAVIAQARGPLTIAQISERARRICPRLGLATVYRTVKLLLDMQRIHALMMPSGERCYEAADLDHHHHFRCRRCRQVYDLPGCLLSIPDGARLPDGFIVDGHEVTLFGTCPECRTSRHRAMRRRGPGAGR